MPIETSHSGEISPLDKDFAVHLLQTGAFALHTYLTSDTTTPGWQTLYDSTPHQPEFSMSAIGRLFTPPNKSHLSVHDGSLFRHYDEQGILEGVSSVGLRKKGEKALRSFSEFTKLRSDRGVPAGAVFYTTFTRGTRHFPVYQTPDEKHGNNLSLSIITPLEDTRELYSRSMSNPSLIRIIAGVAVNTKFGLPNRSWRGNNPEGVGPICPPFRQMGAKDGVFRTIFVSPGKPTQVISFPLE